MIDELKPIADELNLDNDTQDWGIVNANPDRVWEFIKFYEDNINLPDSVKYNLMELIIASYNDYIVEEKQGPTSNFEFVRFIEQHAYDNNVGFIASYWIKIINDEEFPVGKLLRGIDFGEGDRW